MSEQELQQIWLNSSRGESIQFDVSRLVSELRSKLTRLEKVIKKRDIREIVAALIGVPLFGYFAYEIPFPITRIASILTVLYSFYVVYRFRKLQKSRKNDDLTLPFKDQLANQKTNMMAQHRFLDTVLYWYAGPPYLLNVAFILGLGNPEIFGWSSGLVDHLPIDMASKITLIVGLAFFYAFIVWLNKRAVKKTLNPLIADIQRVQDELEKED